MGERERQARPTNRIFETSDFWRNTRVRVCTLLAAGGLAGVCPSLDASSSTPVHPDWLCCTQTSQGDGRPCPAYVSSAPSLLQTEHIMPLSPGPNHAIASPLLAGSLAFDSTKKSVPSGDQTACGDLHSTPKIAPPTEQPVAAAAQAHHNTHLDEEEPAWNSPSQSAGVELRPNCPLPPPPPLELGGGASLNWVEPEANGVLSLWTSQFVRTSPGSCQPHTLLPWKPCLAVFANNGRVENKRTAWENASHTPPPRTSSNATKPYPGPKIPG